MKRCWWKFGHRWKPDQDADFKTFDGRCLKVPVLTCEKCGLHRVTFPANEEGSLLISPEKKAQQ